VTQQHPAANVPATQQLQSPIVIVDYGMGNLRSVQKAFEHIGAHAIITTDADDLQGAPAVVLPGVGAFGDAMRNLNASGMDTAIRRSIEAGTPFLGICLGQQLMFETSSEMGQHHGLGLLQGDVVRFASESLKVPHIGWNQIHMRRPDPLLAGIPDGSFAYFVHSYYVEPADDGLVLATTDYGVDFASIVGRDGVWGVQFHPEKSQAVGLGILTNFVRLAAGGPTVGGA
jgi:glutamine amidotransferase